MPPKSTFKRVSEAEWEALCDLRDIEYERLKRHAEQLQISVDHERDLRGIGGLKHQEQMKACTAVNEMQCARLAEQDLLIRDLRERLVNMTKRALEAEKFAPVVSVAVGEQPLFAKGTTR